MEVIERQFHVKLEVSAAGRNYQRRAGISELRILGATCACHQDQRKADNKAAAKPPPLENRRHVL
jgi:hypothetical protein